MTYSCVYRRVTPDKGLLIDRLAAGQLLNATRKLLMDGEFLAACRQGFKEIITYVSGFHFNYLAKVRIFISLVSHYPTFVISVRSFNPYINNTESHKLSFDLACFCDKTTFTVRVLTKNMAFPTFKIYVLS